MKPPLQDRRGLRFGIAVVAAGLAGAVLRLWSLPSQVVGDDEIHTLRAVLQDSPWDLLTGYQPLDVSPPMAALYRLASDLGVELTELLLRSLPLAAGLALPVLAGLGAARFVGRPPAGWLAWLIALSTPMVLYSRIVRPYGWTVLLGALALWAFHRWWLEEGGRWLALYAVAAALSVWLLPVSAPFVAAPLLFAAGDAARRRSSRAWRRLLLGSAGAGLGVALVLLPALGSLLEVVDRKSGKGEAGAATWLGALQVHAGTGSPALATVFWVLAIVGLVRLARADRSVTLFLALPVAVQAAAVAWTAPLGVGYSLVLERYLLPTLPMVLAWIGVALSPPAGGGRMAKGMAAAGGVLFLAALVATGPFGDPAFRNSPFMQHKEYLAVDQERAVVPPEAVPPVYGSVLPQLPPGPVLEYPWIPAWHQTRALRAYQERHGREVVVGSPAGVLRDPRLAFRNLAPGTPDGFLDSRARHLVVHLAYAAEERGMLDLEETPWPSIFGDRREELELLGRRMASNLEERWGPPDYRDGRVLLWDLARVRREGVGSAR